MTYIRDLNSTINTWQQTQRQNDVAYAHQYDFIKEKKTKNVTIKSKQKTSQQNSRYVYNTDTSVTRVENYHKCIRVVIIKMTLMQMLSQMVQKYLSKTFYRLEKLSPVTTLKYL